MKRWVIVIGKDEVWSRGPDRPWSWDTQAAAEQAIVEFFPVTKDLGQLHVELRDVDMERTP
jgi:hypothetical protein